MNPRGPKRRSLPLLKWVSRLTLRDGKYFPKALNRQGDVQMATRQSIDECIQKCEDAIREGQKQYQAGLGQEHYSDSDYTQAMQKIEESVNDLAQLSQSANAQQREQLHRMRLQVQHLQNEMILLEHDPSTVGGTLH